jgi:hypothetical protein
MVWPFGSAVLHRLFQFLGRSERDLLAGLDLDGLAGRRVPSHPGRPLPHLEDTETGQTDFVAPLQMAGGDRHQIAQHGLGLLLCDLMAVGQRGGEVLERSPAQLLCWRRLLAILPSLLAQLSSSLVPLSSLTRPSSLALPFSPTQPSSLALPSLLALLFSPAELSSSLPPISSLDSLSS